MYKPGRFNNQSRWMTSPIHIALLYALIVGGWILLSNTVLSFLISEPHLLALIEIIEGLLFVIVSTCILYLLLKRSIGAIRRSEEDLRESRRALATLLSNLPGLAYRCCNDREWTMEFVSDGCYGLTGYQPDDLVHNTKISYNQLIHPDDREMVWNEVQAAVQENRPFRLIYRIRTATGAEQWVWEQGRQVPSATGELPALEGFITNITAHKLAMDELRKHQDHLEELVKERARELESAQKTLIQREKLKTLGIIAAEVAHEIRNPLVAIGGFARRLQKKNPQLTESGIILKEAIRLERMLNRITNYLKPAEVSPVGCSINTVLTECVNLLAPELEGRKIKFHVLLGSVSSLVYADPDVLMQIFINIIEHSMDSLQAGDIIITRTFGDEQNIYAEFKIPMAGETIKEPELLSLPFDEGGESIGLPLAYRMVKDMGGLITFSQEESYFVFTVSLPKHDPAKILE